MNSSKVITIDPRRGHHRAACHSSPLKELNTDSMSFTCAAAKPPTSKLNMSALDSGRDRSPLMTERRSTLGSRVYEMLREVEPSLPAIPSSMTEDQTIEYIKVAAGLMRRRQSATIRQVKVLSTELQSREAQLQNSARTARDEDQDRRRLTEKLAQLEAKGREVEAVRLQLCQEREHVQKQSQFMERKMGEIEKLEKRYHEQLREVRLKEEAVEERERSGEKRDKELLRLQGELKAKEELIASLTAKLEARPDPDKRDQLRRKEMMLIAFAENLEQEKVQLAQQKQTFIDQKSSWNRTNRPDQVSMVLEDAYSRCEHLERQRLELTQQMATMQEERSTLESTVMLIETAQDQVAEDRQELIALKRSLLAKSRDLTGKEKAAIIKEKELCILEQALGEKKQALERLEESLDKREKRLQEREGLESPVPLVSTFSFKPQLFKDSRYRQVDLAESLQSSLTPRDVITPVSTEGSPEIS